ncbi:hypothetical protein JCM8547_007715 [Rhodosporidiobolus lusitaniae]
MPASTTLLVLAILCPPTCLFIGTLVALYFYRKTRALVHELRVLQLERGGVGEGEEAVELRGMGRWKNGREGRGVRTRVQPVYVHEEEELEVQTQAAGRATTSSTRPTLPSSLSSFSSRPSPSFGLAELAQLEQSEDSGDGGSLTRGGRGGWGRYERMSAGEETSAGEGRTTDTGEVSGSSRGTGGTGGTGKKSSAFTRSSTSLAFQPTLPHDYHLDPPFQPPFSRPTRSSPSSSNQTNRRRFSFRTGQTPFSHSEGDSPASPPSSAGGTPTPSASPLVLSSTTTGGGTVTAPTPEPTPASLSTSRETRSGQTSEQEKASTYYSSADLYSMDTGETNSGRTSGGTLGGEGGVGEQYSAEEEERVQLLPSSPQQHQQQEKKHYDGAYLPSTFPPSPPSSPLQFRPPHPSRPPSSRRPPPSSSSSFSPSSTLLHSALFHRSPLVSRTGTEWTSVAQQGSALSTPAGGTLDVLVGHGDETVVEQEERLGHDRNPSLASEVGSIFTEHLDLAPRPLHLSSSGRKSMTATNLTDEPESLERFELQLRREQQAQEEAEQEEFDRLLLTQTGGGRGMRGGLPWLMEGKEVDSKGSLVSAGVGIGRVGGRGEGGSGGVEEWRKGAVGRGGGGAGGKGGWLKPTNPDPHAPSSNGTEVSFATTTSASHYSQ